MKAFKNKIYVIEDYNIQAYTNYSSIKVLDNIEFNVGSVISQFTNEGNRI